MDRMRILLAIALLGFGVAAGSAARAADLPAVYPQSFSGNSKAAHRGEMVRLYDDQPGVVMRAYWRAPWHYRHYFPATGIRPRTGRYENLSAVRRPQKPAQTYRRSWSNNWAVQHLYAASVQPLLTGDDDQPGRRSGSRHRPHAHGPNPPVLKP
jgi:hypothetical protein